MRGKYSFENKDALYFWMNAIEPALCMLASGELDEVNYSKYDLSPCLLGQVLDALGYEEGDSEFSRGDLYVNYYNTVTGHKILLHGNVETFSLVLVSCDEE